MNIQSTCQLATSYSTIPDAGATCSIEILTDIPVDSNPFIYFNWREGSAGHAFVQVKKSNGLQSVQQTIGFYPDHPWKTMVFETPLSQKIVDNQHHEYNASLRMDISPAELQTVLNQAIVSSRKAYSIKQYNCTDFALDLFNSVRADNPLNIPKYNIPSNTVP
ncbi:hypothetical protein EXU57_06375 [Segetibacter sp. 3557_3]|uniref:hypothetical protein n=1 Tax=Segetibacter sp. 3557_3 TaxID=2547429 RepID=UPI001058E7AD|nr:hypothetical protein [Segetibacter sp. 3557_3]TDH28082.1 hypothetical protein EXU57_06375 [Segetibacter sp. 3557_3]